MPNSSDHPLLAFLRRLAVPGDHRAMADGELLQRFSGQGEEWAFAALMHRHGPMVLGVCQGLLLGAQDAEDAFQATFLVLARKARAIGKPASVASWLHGVAYRLAMRVRADLARRRACEGKVMTLPSNEPPDDVMWRDLRPVLHEELGRLPERFRLPFVLCYLEGKTNEEAADLLGWPKGTVLSRLSRGRQRLRARLTRRGLAPAGGVVAALLAVDTARAAVPASLARKTFRAALLFAADPTGAIAAPASSYAVAMLRTPFLERHRVTAILLLVTSLVAVSAGASMSGQVDCEQARPAASGQTHAPQSKAPASGPQGRRVIESAPQAARGDGEIGDCRVVFEAVHYVVKNYLKKARGETFFLSYWFRGRLTNGPRAPGKKGWKWLLAASEDGASRRHGVTKRRPDATPNRRADE
jgi:RNA polymerase sigma factor (sigma-70 family)